MFISANNLSLLFISDFFYSSSSLGFYEVYHCDPLLYLKKNNQMFEQRNNVFKRNLYHADWCMMLAKTLSLLTILLLISKEKLLIFIKSEKNEERVNVQQRLTNNHTLDKYHLPFKEPAVCIVLWKHWVWLLNSLSFLFGFYEKIYVKEQ